ncbi:MAG: AraC family transcriptional regulator [Bacillota bacterium]
MTVHELSAAISGELASSANASGEVKCALACDLLSLVMAKGRPGCAWVTVQTHLNVIAVASLHEMSCVIFPGGIDADEATLQKAYEEGLAVIKSPLSTYEICGILYAKGVPASEE